MKTLKQNGRRDAAKGAFKTDPESNNKSLPSLPPSLTFQKPQGELERKFKKHFFCLVYFEDVQRTKHQSVNEHTESFKTVQVQFCHNYYIVFIAHFRGQNSVCKCLSRSFFQKVGTHWYKKTDGKTSMPLFWASLK